MFIDNIVSRDRHSFRSEMAERFNMKHIKTPDGVLPLYSMLRAINIELLTEFWSKQMPERLREAQVFIGQSIQKRFPVLEYRAQLFFFCGSHIDQRRSPSFAM